MEEKVGNFELIENLPESTEDEKQEKHDYEVMHFLFEVHSPGRHMQHHVKPQPGSARPNNGRVWPTQTLCPESDKTKHRKLAAAPTSHTDKAKVALAAKSIRRALEVSACGCYHNYRREAIPPLTARDSSPCPSPLSPSPLAPLPPYTHCLPSTGPSPNNLNTMLDTALS